MASSTDYPQERVEQIVALAKAKAFLGREFLTWLWFYIESQKGKHFLPQEEGMSDLEVDLWLDDRLVLESQSARAHESVIKGGAPSQSQEASYGLQSGKTVKELKLGVNMMGVGEFSAVLNGSDLNPRSLKLPNPGKPETIVDPDETPVVTRIRHTELFLSLIDHLFSQFIDQRIADGYEAGGLKDIRNWVKGRVERTGKTIH